MVPKSASSTNVRNASSWQVEVAGGERMSEVGVDGDSVASVSIREILLAR